MKERFFDFEVFPHWWCCTFGDMPDTFPGETITEDIKDTFVVVRSDKGNPRDELLQLMQQEGFVQIGYNIKRYDLVIANAIYQGFSPEEVFVISDLIIQPESLYKDPLHMRLGPTSKRKLKCVFQDLLDDSEGSLKDKEAIMGLNILESSVSFLEENLTEEQKEDVIYYNKQDVYASMKFYEDIVYPYTQTKLAIGKTFNIPETTCLASTNARLVSLVLQAKRTVFTDAEETIIKVPSKIQKYCLDNVPGEIYNHLVYGTGNLSVKAFGNDVDYGSGGIHSVLSKNIYVESDDEYCLINVDATSYYPSMLIQFDCLSRCVPSKEIFTNIYNERIRIKHLEHKTEQDNMKQLALKLVLNTTFGASGNKWLDLFDPYQCIRTCRLGQLFLTALACRIVNNVPSAKVIQTNTDGILLYIRRKDVCLVDKFMQEWTDVSGISMERDDVQKIWQRDVNNYLLVKTNGKAKRKGGWLNDEYRRPGYVTVGSLDAFVCTRAAQQWLLNGKDVAKSILENKNVTDYVMSCKKGPTYSKVVQKFADGTEQELFKCNRVYASKDTNLGKIYKIKMYKGNKSYTQMSSIPDNCRLINDDLSHYTFDDIKKDLDYAYYLDRAMDILDIPWQQVIGNKIIDTDKFDYKI